jgi:hypothetical protein
MKHFDCVRGIPGELLCKSISHLNRQSSQDLQVSALLGEIGTLKGLLVA